MRRIFTFSLLAATLIVASFNSSAQTCSVSTTNPLTTPPAGTPGFGSAITVNSTNGFRSGNQTVLGTYDNGQTDSLLSPIFYYPTTVNGSNPQTSIYFKYDLAAATNPGAQITAYTITVRYGSTGQVFTCSQTTTINLTTTATAYYFTISGISMPPNTNFEIRLDFTVTGGGSNRNVVATNFQTNATPATGSLPVKFSSFEAKSVNGGTALTWNVASEDNVARYEVEKSSDNRNYATIGSVDASGNDVYSLLDTKASSGTVNYRVKAVDMDGRLTYSAIVTLKGGRSTVTLRAFPMPAGNELTLQHSTATSESLISISSAEGREVKAVVPAKGTQQTVVSIASLRPGMYVVRYTTGNGEVETLKIVKQ